MGFPFGIAFFGDLFHRPAGFDRLVFEFFGRRFYAVARFHDQPGVLFSIPAADSDKRPFALRLFARENKMKLSFAKGFEWLLSVNIVGAAIPNHDRAAAVLPLRNNSLKAFIIDRMIFDFDGEMFLAFLPGQTLWQCPRFQNALHLE